MLAPNSLPIIEGLTSIRSSFGPNETMDWLEAQIRAKGMTAFGCIDHSAGKTWMSYDEPELCHENIARYCSTHNYCSAGSSSRERGYEREWNYRHREQSLGGRNSR